MKRLHVLLVFAVFALPLPGCCNAWPRWWGYRGDPCNVYPTYESAPAVEGAWMVAPEQGTEVLPGPATAEPST